MTRIIVRTRPLCNRQPLARCFQPLSVSRDGDVDDTKTTTLTRCTSAEYVVVNVSHTTSSWKGGSLVSSRRGFFFCLPAITAPLLKTTATAPRRSPWLLCMRVSRVEGARRSRNDSRCNFARSFLSSFSLQTATRDSPTYRNIYQFGLSF